MAASETDPSIEGPTAGARLLSAAQLAERAGEEIARAERQRLSLSCVVLLVENLDEIASEHGGDLRAQILAYIASALSHELRSFDRVGVGDDGTITILLPGAAGARAEMVARRLLERTRTIKLEADGSRRPLRLSAGLASWREGADAQELCGRARRSAGVGRADLFAAAR